VQLAGLLISAGGGNVGRRTDFISPLSAMATHPKSSSGGGRGGRRKALFAALAAELARRSPPVEQACEQLVETLGEMALRLAATTPLCPLQLDDMSPAELLSCHFLPEHLRPPGLPTEDEILAKYRDRQGR